MKKNHKKKILLVTISIKTSTKLTNQIILFARTKLNYKEQLQNKVKMSFFKIFCLLLILDFSQILCCVMK